MGHRDDTRDTPQPRTATFAGAPNTPTDSAQEGTRAQTPAEVALSAEASGGLPTIPGYEIVGELGQGGMGVVYRARQLAFDRDIALKVLKQRYAADSLAAKRFLEEARVTAQLQHPAIPPVHEVGTLPDGRPYLAMKLIKGETLAELLGRQPADRPRLVAVFAQVCLAVAYAHARKVIHRDLKPSNVMVGAFGEVQVMDWGLAKVLTDRQPEPVADAPEGQATEIRAGREPDSATQTGSVLLGTPAFMSPEQAAGEVAKIDERADVFGLGAVFCTILTGEPPYTGADTESVRLMAIRGETADALRRLDACGADSELVALAKRCLAAHRGERPRDGVVVAEAVSAHLVAAEEHARRSELEAVRAAEERKRRRAQLALGGAVLILLVLVGLGVGLVALWREAVGARREVETARDQLDIEKRQAVADRAEALRLKGVADAALSGEASAKAEVERQRERIARVEYARTVQVAYALWKDNKVADAHRLLASTRPDLRQWEWGYVHRLCHSDLVTSTGRPRSMTDSLPSSMSRTTRFSPDGLRFVTASGEHSARICSVATGEVLVELNGHTSRVLCASFSPDGSRVVTASEDNSARIWDAKTGQSRTLLSGHAKAVTAAFFIAGGARVATSSEDETVRVWDAAKGTVISSHAPKASPFGGAWFGPDGSAVLSADVGRAELCGPDGKTRFALGDDFFLVTQVGFSPDNSKVAISGLKALSDGSDYRFAMRIMDVATGKTQTEIAVPKSLVITIAFSPDGSKVVTGGDDATGRIWDAKSGKLLAELRGHTGLILQASFSPDGSKVVMAGTDASASIWEVGAWRLLTQLKGHSGAVYYAAFSPDGSKVLTEGVDGSARIWAAAAQDGQHVVRQPGDYFSAYHREERLLGVAQSGDQLTAVDGATGRALSSIKVGEGESSQHLAVSPDGRRVVTANYKTHGVRVWSISGRKVVAEHAGHSDYIASIVFSSDGSMVATASADRTARVWSAENGQLVAALKGHAGRVRFAAFSHDASMVVTGSEDGTARLWESKTGRVIRELPGHKGAVRFASFSRDGARVATVGGDNAVRIWSAGDGKVLAELDGAEGVRSAAFSPDGAPRLLTLGEGTIRLWDTETWVQVLVLPGGDEVEFSPDGNVIVTSRPEFSWLISGQLRNFLVGAYDSRPVNRAFLKPPAAPAPRPLGTPATP